MLKESAVVIFRDIFVRKLQTHYVVCFHEFPNSPLVKGLSIDPESSQNASLPQIPGVRVQPSKEHSKCDTFDASDLIYNILNKLNILTKWKFWNFEKSTFCVTWSKDM